MPNTKPYNKEEVMKEWENEFTHLSSFGFEKQLSQFCATNRTKDTPIFQEESPIVTKHKAFLSTALTAAEQAGEKRIMELLEVAIQPSINPLGTSKEDVYYSRKDLVNFIEALKNI